MFDTKLDDSRQQKQAYGTYTAEFVPRLHIQLLWFSELNSAVRESSIPDLFAAVKTQLRVYRRRQIYKLAYKKVVQKVILISSRPMYYHDLWKPPRHSPLSLYPMHVSPQRSIFRTRRFRSCLKQTHLLLLSTCSSACLPAHPGPTVAFDHIPTLQWEGISVAGGFLVPSLIRLDITEGQH